MRSRRFILPGLWLIAACLYSSTAWAQIEAIDDFLGRSKQAEPPPAAATAPLEQPSPQKQAADLQSKRDSVAERLSVAQRALETTDKPTAPHEGLSGEVERLKRLKVLYAQQQAAETRHAELEAQKRQADEQTARLSESGLGEGPPYSFFLLDQLRDEMQTLQERAESASAAIGSATQALQGAKASVDEVKRHRRHAADEPASARLSQLDAQITDEQVKLRKAELANERLNKEALALATALVQEKIDRVAPQVTLSTAEQQEKLLELDKDEADLQYALTEAEERLQYLSKRVAQAASADPPAAEPDPKRALELEARRVARSAQQQYVSMLNKQFQRVGERREAWKRRFAVQRNTATRAQVIHWAAEAAEAVDQLAREDRLQDREVNAVRKQLANVEVRLQSVAPDDAELRRTLSDERRVQQDLINQFGENITSIELARSVHQRLLADIREDRISFGERIYQVWHSIQHVWSYEIVVSDGQPVTVSMVFWGIVLLVLGLLASRYASAALGGRFLPRLGIHESAAAALQTITFYTLVMLTALLALRWVNVPLTLFTFLGGAVAIGIGFGSQNLVNNFISGLILLAERPIRVGDVIEIDGLVGAVDTIGARSTRIRTANNFEIIVPNSSFLERNVVNWTLSDKRLRCSISVGMAYGSPTRDVARWLKKAAEEHGQVLERPEPFVWFVDFGDNALQFELHYWIQIRVISERRRIESDLRFIIDQYFREAGLVIAYPQRDLHLTTQQPLQVALLPPHELAAAEEAAKAA
ncbi:MAG: mechanosensitive ion channel domain-containing protein [Pirellulales bacterium]